MDKKFLTVRETAELLGVPAPTVYFWLNLGKIPKARAFPGPTGRRQWRIPRGSLRQLQKRIADGLPIGA